MPPSGPDLGWKTDALPTRLLISVIWRRVAGDDPAQEPRPILANMYRRGANARVRLRRIHPTLATDGLTGKRETCLVSGTLRAGQVASCSGGIAIARSPPACGSCALDIARSACALLWA